MLAQSTSAPLPDACDCACENAAVAIANLNNRDVCRTILCFVNSGLLVPLPDASEHDAKGKRWDAYSLSAMLDTKQVAVRLRVSLDWVRRHKRDLGAISLGGGGHGADLRFPESKVEEYLRSCARHSRRGVTR
jgi:hypothetical protein